MLVSFVFVIIRRLSSISSKDNTNRDTHLLFRTRFLAHGILEWVASIMQRYLSDAVLQASACGVLATFVQGDNFERMLALRVPNIMIIILVEHQSLNHYLRQVHLYASEGMRCILKIDRSIDRYGHSIHGDSRFTII
jgi:hypothetical protein